MEKKLPLEGRFLQGISELLVRIHNGDILHDAENDSSSAYWIIEGLVDDIILDMHKETKIPLYDMREFAPNEKSRQWHVFQVTNDSVVFASKDKSEAFNKLQELNKEFLAGKDK